MVMRLGRTPDFTDPDDCVVQISKKSLRYLSEMFERSLNRNVENLDLIYEDEAMEG